MTRRTLAATVVIFAAAASPAAAEVASFPDQRPLPDAVFASAARMADAYWTARGYAPPPPIMLVHNDEPTVVARAAAGQGEIWWSRDFVVDVRRALQRRPMWQRDGLSLIARTAVHEVGHQIGFAHAPGVMAEYVTDAPMTAEVRGWVRAQMMCLRKTHAVRVTRPGRFDSRG